MRVMDVAGFLAGRRRAILALWSDRWCLPIGAVLVVSGSLARNYDGHDLVREWTVLLHGLGASTVNAFLLFALLHVAMRLARKPDIPPAPSFWKEYPAFLGVFWMTAPMAWVYGVPWEHLLEPVEAVRANLWTLAAVSAWRVLLMARVLSVVYGLPMPATLVLTCLFGDLVAFAALAVAPVPTIDFMGGLRHPPEIELIARTAFSARVWSVLLAPGLLIAAVLAGRWLRPHGAPPVPRPAPLPRGAMIAAGVVIAGWLSAAWFAQPAVRRKVDVERAVAEGRFADAAGLLCRPRADFPPVWDLPPRATPVYRSMPSDVPAMRRALEANPDTPPWVFAAFVHKTRYELASRGFRAWQEGQGDPRAFAAHFEGCESWARAAVEFVAKHDATLTAEQLAWWAGLAGALREAERASRRPGG